MATRDVIVRKATAPAPGKSQSVNQSVSQNNVAPSGQEEHLVFESNTYVKHRERERYPIKLRQHKLLVRCLYGKQPYELMSDDENCRRLCPECGTLMHVITEQE